MTSDLRAFLQQRWLPLILISALLLLLGWALARQMELVEEELDLGPTREAQRNPFLASQRLLERYDIPYRSQHGFSGLENMQWEDEAVGRYDTLILVNTYHNLHERQIERLWRWVEDGGRLIVSVENPFIGSGEHLRDPLLTRMGLTLHSNYSATLSATLGESEEDESPTEDTAPDEDANADGEEGETEGNSPEGNSCWMLPTAPARLGPDAPELSIGVSGASYLSAHNADIEILSGDESAIFLARQQKGYGEIHVITSARAWQNSYIGCDDNAYLFWRLTDNSPKVWYAINLQTPSFWRHLWQLSATSCVALLLALAFWLWTQGTRFGPILPQANRGRPRFMDHIRAAAQFTLRHQGSAALVELLRDDIHHSANKRYPGFARMERSDQIGTMQKMSGADTGDIELALFHPLPLSEAQFLDVVKCLQHLRNRI